MPLRAKIISPKPILASQMSSSPKNGADDVLAFSLYGLRTLELHRPAKLNSLNESMMDKIAPRLIEWDKADLANVVVMKGSGDKAFCAGGDVANLAKWNQEGPQGQRKSTEFFAKEYALNHLISTYQTPYIAFMDGITMGGGVGLSMHAPLRIATERTVFAMPETAIGFFPEVGATFFLSRLAGGLGTYLALTGDRVQGVNVLYSGLATHYLHSATLPLLESRLAELRFNDYDTLDERLAVISATIEEYTTGLPHDVPMLIAGDLRKAIDRCFGKDSLVQIIAALDQEDATDETRQWAQSTLHLLHQRSPTGLHVALMQMRRGRDMSIQEALESELFLASKFMAHPDFVEGVSARLINKPPTTPTWVTKGNLGEDNGSAYIRELMAEKPGEGVVQAEGEDEPKIKFYNDRNFYQYPHASIGLPTENDVKQVLQDKNLTPSEILEHFHELNRVRLGAKEVVEEIVQRKVVADATGKAVWQK